MSRHRATDEGSGRRTLSTGHEVTTPLSLDARITGAAFSAPRTAVASLLPDGLVPLRLTPQRAVVTFLSVDYGRIGADAMAPYDELSVQIPAVTARESTVPFLSAVAHVTDGYVWYMPVSTEPAKALGREVWGYPKVVADVDVDHGRSRTRTTVTVDGDRVLTLSVARPRAFRTRRAGYTLTELDGRLLRERTVVDGEFGVWPLSTAATVEFGDHPRGERLDRLGLGGRAVCRIAADCEMTLHPGVAERR